MACPAWRAARPLGASSRAFRVLLGRRRRPRRAAAACAGAADADADADAAGAVEADAVLEPPRAGGAGGGGGGEGWEAGVRSSPVVAEEGAAIADEFSSLASMQLQYPQFDRAGKELYCARLEAVLDSLEAFVARYRLSAGEGDAYAAEQLEQLEEMMGGAGLKLDAVQVEMRHNLVLMRELLEAEARLGVDVAKEVEAAREANRDVDGSRGGSSSGAAGGAGPGAGWSPKLPDFEAMLADPAAMACIQDPAVMAKMQEVLTDPEAMLKHQHDPKIRALIDAVWGEQWREQLEKRGYQQRNPGGDGKGEDKSPPRVRIAGGP